MGDEIVELRREKASLERDKRLMSKEIIDWKRGIDVLKEQYDNLWYQMFFNCPSEDVANVLIALGWQGNVNSEYVDDMKKGFSR